MTYYNSRKTLNTIVKNIIGASKMGKPTFQFRASCTPFCKLYYILTKINEAINAEQYEMESYFSDFYTNAGTAMHETFQKWAGRLGYLWGDWYCYDCHPLFEEQYIIRNRLGPQVCPHGHELTYMEKEFKHSSGLSGHIDLILYDPTNHYWFLSDIKSTGKGKMNDVRDQNLEMKYFNYVTQVNTYYWALVKEHKIQINKDNVYIIFLGRWYHEAFKIIKVPVYEENYFDDLINEYQDTKQKLYSNNKEVLTMEGVCENIEEAEYCYFKDICFSISKSKIIEEYFNKWQQINKE